MKRYKKLQKLVAVGVLLSLLSGCGTATQNVALESQKSLETQGEAGNTVGNTNLNIMNLGIAAEQGGKVYFEDNGKLYSANANGKSKKELTTCDTNSPNINVVGDWIYYFDKEGFFEDDSVTYGIYKIKTNGKDKSKILDLNTWWTSFIVSDDMIYYFDENGLYKADVNGENIVPLVSTAKININTMDRRVYLCADNQKLMFCLSMDTDEYLHQDYYVIGIDGSNLQPITSVLPGINWENVWNDRNGYVHMVPISEEWIMIDDSCYDWEGNLIFAVYRDGFDYFNYYNGYILFTAENKYWVDEEGEDCMFIFNPETGSSFVVQNLESTFEADSGGEMLCLAGNNLFFYTEVEADPELIDGQWVQGSMHSLQILNKESLDSYVERMEEENNEPNEVAIQ